MKHQTNSSSAFFRAILPVATIAVATLLKVVCMLAQQKLSHLKIQVSMHVQGVTSTATTGCPNKFLVKISNIYLLKLVVTLVCDDFGIYVSQVDRKKVFLLMV